MLKISDFFKRIQNKYSQELYVRSVIQASLKKYINLEVPLESISFKSATIVLKGIPQVARSQIFIKKQTILDDIKANQDIRVVSDIK